MKKTFALLALLALLNLSLAAKDDDDKGKVPEGTLNTHLNYNPKEVPEQLALVIQEVYKLKTELIVSNFRQEYGDRIRSRRITYAANTDDREAIPAYVFTPVKMPAGKKFPAILMLHGGNHTQLADIWFPLIAAAIERGYIVMYPEYRGSSGHGDTIYENNYGITDFADILAAADYLGSRDFVDPARLGIFGHSRGGMLTLRAIQEDKKRFAAAVEVAALTDMVGFMGWKPEVRRQDIAAQKGFGGKLPDKNLPAYMAISPVFFAEKTNTPVLVISTTGDKTNVYQLNNKRMVEGLKAYGKVFEEKLYDNAPGGHMFLFADTEEARDSLKRTFDWFAKYLTP